MRRALVPVCLAVSVGVFSAPPCLRAQTGPAITFEAVRGQAGASFDGSWAYWDPSREEHTTTWREWVLVSLGGAVFHPKVFTFQLRARPEFIQGSYLPRVESVSSDASGSRFSGDARINLFSGFEINGSAFANRFEGMQRTRFGGWSDGYQTTWGAVIRDRNPLLPATLRYERRIRDRRTFSGFNGRTYATDDDLTMLRYRARNSKTLIVLERVALRNRSAFAFERTGAEFQHVLRWGKGSTLRSTLRYTGQRTVRTSKSFAWSEAASLRQGRHFWTNLGAAYGRQSSASGDGGNVQGTTGIRYRPSSDLDIGVDGLARRTSVGSFVQDYARVGPSGTVVLKLPASASLVVDLSAAYEWRTEDSPEGIVADAIQEAQVVGPAGTLRLEQPFVVPGTIVLSAEDGSQIYDEGLDYQLFSDGPYTEIHVLPGSRLAPGDAVFVDYRYRLQGGVGANAIALTYGVTLRRGVFNLYARGMRHTSLDDVPAGTIIGIRDLERSTFGAMVNLSLGRASASVIAEYAADRFDVVESRATVSRASVAVPVYRQLVALTSVEYQRRRVSEGRAFEKVQMEHELSAPIGPRTRVRGGFSYWTWRGGVTPQRFAGVEGGVEWSRGAVEASLTYDRAQSWSRFDRSQHRLVLDLSRRF